jgi:CDP-diacylglycerol--glycerol-3-phosphate 3-phosphatidyltransferase
MTHHPPRLGGKDARSLNDKGSSPRTFSDGLRFFFRGVLDPIGGVLLRLGFTPNALTLLGLVGTAIGGYLLSAGNLLHGGALLIFMGPIDALDGTMARLRGEPSDFGGFIDSVTDRYAELLIFGGLLVHYLRVVDHTGALLTFAAASGSVLVSYVKARAEGLGFQARIGLMARFERYLVLVVSLVLNQAIIGLALIAVLANFTAVQRILHVRIQGHARMAGGGPHD